MQKNLVIVESPAKAKTIQRYLGDDYKVMSSYGHIRDLKKKNFGIDLETFKPQYEVPKDKTQIVQALKTAAAKAENVWLASDEDREGEAISWHLAEVLGLSLSDARRIVFHEITKPAILNAIKTPRAIDLNLVDAQQARRVLDRIVGFKLSPVLWRKVKPSLSAGRVQSVAVRLIVEREREIQKFKSESSYRVVADFNINDNVFRAELNRRFTTADEARAFLEACKTADFEVSDISVHPQKRTPAPPFTTSTLQQEAARKFGYPVSLTMRIAQNLYEAGLITYMRTDSFNLSSFCINASKELITRTLGKEYSKPRKYVTHTKGAQEAHEAIRPTDMANEEINIAELSRNAQAQRLYKLIRQRTIACQMSDAELEKTTVEISVAGHEEKFIAQGEVVKFDGFLRVYRESRDNEETANENRVFPPMNKGEHPQCAGITATQRFTQHPARYSEAALVHKMEELGIGRPSTYAPIITTIQNRQYVVRGDKEGTAQSYDILSLKNGKITNTTKTETTGAEKNKLTPTDVGIVVTDFLKENFPEIMDYNFTADVEKQFDEVAEGKKEWTGLMHDFYENFEPVVEKTLADKSRHKAGERQLGIDPQTGRPVFVKIGRYGPMVQLGQAGDEEKPVFATMKKGQSTETLTLEEALELFKLPRTLGSFEDADVTIAIGRFGPYVKHNNKYVSLPKGEDPLKISLDEAIELILSKRESEAKRLIKTFEEDPALEILDGPYGIYLSYKKKNYRLPQTKRELAAQLTFAECMKIINDDTEKPKRTSKARSRKKS